MENKRDKAHELVKRAQDSGYDTLMVTVDTAVAGSRHRDMRNGMTFPPKLTWKTFADASYKFEWWSNFLTTEPLAVTNFGEGSQSFQEIGTMFDPTLNFADLATYITHWNTTRRQVKLKGLTPGLLCRPQKFTVRTTASDSVKTRPARKFARTGEPKLSAWNQSSASNTIKFAVFPTSMP